MSEVLFVADTHLDPRHPDTIGLFSRFLNQRAVSATALYLLGDLFETWIGDDEPVNPALSPVINEFANLQNSQVEVYFSSGNRDFLLGQTFMRQFGWIALPEEFVITLNDQRMLLMHGDTLCTDDISYQRYRRIIRSSISNWFLRHLPLTTRRKIAQSLREKSMTATGQKQVEIMDVNSSTVSEKVRKHNVDIIIHGHTHRPNIHQVHQDTLKYTRIVLGDWHGSGTILAVNDNGYRLEKFS